MSIENLTLTFELSEFPAEGMDGETFVLLSISHGASEAIGGSGSKTEMPYANSFTCFRADMPSRPPLTTLKPMIGGVQTAIVVGSSGQEIYTDEHGKVKVQFHWDREGARDENSSCWVRVAQRQTGNRWGDVFIPRIGQEVIVNFLEGDPDRPIITSAVYNGLNRPPYYLPDGMTKSAMKSYSTPGGGGAMKFGWKTKRVKSNCSFMPRRLMTSASRMTATSGSVTIVTSPSKDTN